MSDKYLAVWLMPFDESWRDEILDQAGAAHAAHRLLLDPNNLATVFSVFEGSAIQAVDALISSGRMFDTTESGFVDDRVLPQVVMEQVGDDVRITIKGVKMPDAGPRSLNRRAFE